MFYSNHEVSFRILNIFHVKRNAEKTYNTSRPWSAISFRNSGTSVFSSNGKEITADPGSVLYIPENASYERVSTEEDLIIVHIKCFGTEDREIQLFSSDNAVQFSKEFFELLKTWNQCSPGYIHSCSAILHRIFEEMEAFDFKNPKNNKKDIIKNSLIYMNMNYDNPEITIGEIAKQSNISEVYFRKLYKEIYGFSPNTALQNMRLERAGKLLQSGYFNITETAEKSGFANAKYFSTLFRKKNGKTPSEYLNHRQR